MNFSFFLMNMFSSFDFMNFYWQILSFSLFIFICMNLLYKVNFVSVFLNYFYANLSKFFHSLNKMFFSEFMFLFSISLIMFIFYFNFSSVFPYTFPLCSQPSYVILFSLSVWLMIFFKQIFNNSKGFISHCIPEGSPIYLSFLLFLIEVVSNIIRPLTLGVRLCANILAGHLLMILLSQLVMSIPLLTPLYCLLNLVELFVSLIQSYIFLTLIVLYMSEVK